MSFTFDNTIPAANNNPSSDQPKMLQNNQTLASWVGVDHTGFNNADGGTHSQVTLINVASPSPPTDPVSYLYSTQGTETAVSEATFMNQSGTFPASSIRAWGNFTVVNASGAVTNNVSYNVVSNTAVVAAGVGTYTITLTNNTTGSDNVVVLTTISDNDIRFRYSFASNVLTLIVNSIQPRLINFCVIQY